MNKSPQSAGVARRTTDTRFDKNAVYEDSCLYIEHKAYFFAVKGTPVALTKTEFRIVSRLIIQLDRIVTLEVLWNSAWSPKQTLVRKSIHVFVSRIRHKLAPLGLKIHSVIGVGYILSHGTCCSPAMSTTAGDEDNQESNGEPANHS